MISFDVIWYGTENDQSARVGNYRLNAWWDTEDECGNYYVDHVFPYAGGEGIEIVKHGHGLTVSLEHLKQTAERYLLLELLRQS